MTIYITVSTIWSIARDLGNSAGSCISDMIPKKETWAIKAKTMLVTARKASTKVGSVVISIGSLNANRDHSDDSSNQDTDSGDSRHDEHLVSSPREGANAADDQTDNAEDDGAGAMVGDGVEEHREGENMAGHEEDDEE